MDRPPGRVPRSPSLSFWSGSSPGPIFNYSDTWQLVINTGTTIVTFLMVFLIQNTQNRDTMALQLKLSELVLAMKGAQNKFAAVEDLSDEELEELHEDCKKRAELTLDHLQSSARQSRESRAPQRNGPRPRSDVPPSKPDRSFCGTAVPLCAFSDKT